MQGNPAKLLRTSKRRVVLTVVRPFIKVRVFKNFSRFSARIPPAAEKSETMVPETTTVTTDYTPSPSTGALANTRISVTPSERLSSYPASTPATQTPSPPPTIPPGGTKTVNMEVTLEMDFREEYNDVNSPVYKELVTNLSSALIKVYQEVDGFVGLRVLFIREGSVVCNYIVILARNSRVTDDDLKKELGKGKKDGKFPFTVKGIAVIEDSVDIRAKKQLPQWAMTTMIALGALAFCFLVIAIYACVSIRNLWFLFHHNYYYLLILLLLLLLLLFILHLVKL